MEFAFYLSGFMLLYVYAGYPILIWLLGRWRCVRIEARADFTPHVTLIISAFNEEPVIRAKLANSLALDYPRELLEIIVASDGSTDGTDEAVREYAREGVRLIRHHGRIGKSSMLNLVVPVVAGDIVVLSDANAMYEPGAIRAIVRHFADSRVGCVCGELRYRVAGDGLAKNEGLFWRYEVQLKKWESRLGTLLGANGSIFAFRRELFQPLNPMLSNDFETPFQIARRGFLVAYESHAVSWEPGSPNFLTEFRRHARISARAFHGAFTWTRQLLYPLRSLLLLEFLSRKLLRWLTPFLMIVLLLTSALAGGWFASTLLWIQILFYSLCLGIAGLCYFGLKPPRLISAPLYFVLLNAAVFAGFCKWVAGQQAPTWDPNRVRP
jgi:cellulose synthase/poly-beta-1,6-N-acetylglucosamine synthase-like glycosyltransferase